VRSLFMLLLSISLPPYNPHNISTISLPTLALLGSGSGDGRGSLLVLDGATAASTCLDGLDDTHARCVTLWHTSEDYVTGVQPGSNDGCL
jgi:hypothetical protein